MATFVIVHGAWGGGWAWRTVRNQLRAASHEVFTPTLTGLGERSHLGRPETNLDTHIQDIVNVLEYEDLTNVILAGHSYAGMVITGAADRAASRLRHLVYLDAFVPSDGQSLLDLLSPEARAAREKQTNLVDGWRIPPGPLAPDTPSEIVKWAMARRGPQPLQTYAQPVRLTGAATNLPRTYVHCTYKPDGDVFAESARQARENATWSFHSLPTGHNLQYTATKEVTEILLGIAAS